MRVTHDRQNGLGSSDTKTGNGFGKGKVPPLLAHDFNCDGLLSASVGLVMACAHNEEESHKCPSGALTSCPLGHPLDTELTENLASREHASKGGHMSGVQHTFASRLELSDETFVSYDVRSDLVLVP